MLLRHSTARLVSIAAALLALCAAQASAQDKPLKKVRLAVGTSFLNVGYPMNTLPVTLGYWKAEGYDVEVLPVGASLQALQQMVAGNAEFGQVNASVIVQANSKNDLPARIVMGNGVIDWSIAVDANGPIKSVKDLKGKTIGVFSLATGGVAYFNNLLRANGLDPALEPTFANELRLNNFRDCHYGIRVYEEFRQQMEAQAGGVGVPHYVTEWNSMVGRAKDDLTDGAWPCNNYPQGLLRAAVRYLAPQDHLLGFGVFVDKDPKGDTPFWRASAARGHVNGADLTEEQRARLAVWDAEMDEIFQHGW